MERTVCVGGFLGAGKTTALLQAAGKLIARGLKVGVITNDQGSNRVDAALFLSALEKTLVWEHIFFRCLSAEQGRPEHL
jgi:G3E family GTPase